VPAYNRGYAIGVRKSADGGKRGGAKAALVDRHSIEILALNSGRNEDTATQEDQEEIEQDWFRGESFSGVFKFSCLAAW